MFEGSHDTVPVPAAWLVGVATPMATVVAIANPISARTMLCMILPPICAEIPLTVKHGVGKWFGLPWSHRRLPQQPSKFR